MKENFQRMQWLVFDYQHCVWLLSLLFSYSAQNCFFFSTSNLPLASEHGEVVVIYDSITLALIRLQKEILQQATISNYLLQHTNKPIRLLNISLASVFPNRGAAAPQGAIYDTQGCREKRNFAIYHWKLHFQNVIESQSKLLWLRHWVPQILFFSVGCRKPKKVGKHWSSSWFSEENQSILTPLLRNCVHSNERNSTKAFNHLFEET